MDVIFDLDGTLADCKHRLHHIKTKPKNYGKFYATICDDPMIEGIVAVHHALRAQFNRIIYCTGREETCRVQTASWIINNLYDEPIYPGETPVPPSINLYMRPKGDYRKDFVVKRELLDKIIEDGFDPKLVFDDRPSVCRMWKEAGLLVCRVGEAEEF